MKTHEETPEQSDRDAAEDGSPALPPAVVEQASGFHCGPGSYAEQDENGVDLSLIRENLRLSPTERVRRGDRARKDALRLLEYGRRNREKLA